MEARSVLRPPSPETHVRSFPTLQGEGGVSFATFSFHGIAGVAINRWHPGATARCRCLSTCTRSGCVKQHVWLGRAERNGDGSGQWHRQSQCP